MRVRGRQIRVADVHIDRVPVVDEGLQLVQGRLAGRGTVTETEELAVLYLPLEVQAAEQVGVAVGDRLVTVHDRPAQVGFLRAQPERDPRLFLVAAQAGSRVVVVVRALESRTQLVVADRFVADDVEDRPVLILSHGVAPAENLHYVAFSQRLREREPRGVVPVPPRIGLLLQDVLRAAAAGPSTELAGDGRLQIRHLIRVPKTAVELGHNAATALSQTLAPGEPGIPAPVAAINEVVRHRRVQRLPANGLCLALRERLRRG